MNTVRTLIRLTSSEIQEIKTLAKKTVTFPISFTVNKEKYGKGTFNILPTKKAGRKFTEDQALEVIEFLNENNLYSQSFSVAGQDPSTYWQGISYICKIEV